MKRTMTVLVAIVIATMVIPGLIAYLDHVFFVADMAPRIARSVGSPEINAFSVNRLNMLWWPLFALLAIVLLSTSPSATETIKTAARTSGSATPRTSVWRLVFVTLAMFVMFDIPSWARNFVLGDEDRHVYSFVNWDISKASYLYQELEVLAIMVLIAWTIERWERYYRVVLGAYPPAKSFSQAELLPQLSKELSRWQLASLATAALFGAWLAFYMGNIIVRRDHRYIPSALILQAFGIATWWEVTRPVAHLRRLWITARNTALKQAADDLATADIRLKVIAALEPANQWSAVLSSVVVLITFLLPIIRAVLGK